MSRMRNPVICYFVFKNQSHYSGVRGQRVKSTKKTKNYIPSYLPGYGEFENLCFVSVA